MWPIVLMLAVAVVGLIVIRIAKEGEAAAIGVALTAVGLFLAMIFAMVGLFY